MNTLDLFKLFGGNITNFLSDYGILATFVLVVTLTCVQLIPQFKWNPWTSLFRGLGRLINSEVLNEVKGIK